MGLWAHTEESQRKQGILTGFALEELPCKEGKIVSICVFGPIMQMWEPTWNPRSGMKKPSQSFPYLPNPLFPLLLEAFPFPFPSCLLGR